MASGSYQLCVGESVNLAISQPSVSRSLGKIVTVINEHLLDEWVRFPMDDLLAIKQR
jgi:hypothetical protein